MLIKRQFPTIKPSVDNLKMHYKHQVMVLQYEELTDFQVIVWRPNNSRIGNSRF